LVDATYQARNAGSLGAAVREVNRIRYLVRLAKDLRVMNLAGHEFASKAMDEVGRMAGGWLKSTRQRYFNTTPKFWLNLQASYHLAMTAAAKAREIERTVHPREPA
jgi:hypothetical protein